MQYVNYSAKFDTYVMAGADFDTRCQGFFALFSPCIFSPLNWFDVITLRTLFLHDSLGRKASWSEET